MPGYYDLFEEKAKAINDNNIRLCKMIILLICALIGSLIMPLIASPGLAHDTVLGFQIAIWAIMVLIAIFAVWSYFKGKRDIAYLFADPNRSF